MRGERVHFVAHVHPFTIYPKLFKTLFLGFGIPLIGMFLMPPFKWMWLGWLGLGGLIFTYQMMQWYLDAWIITNLSVIDHEWKNFFNKTTTRIEFGNIEGVTTTINGFWGTILRYGTLQIEHMSGTTILIKDVARPKRVESFIVRYQQEFNRIQTVQDHSKLKDLLTSLLHSGMKK